MATLRWGLIGSGDIVRKRVAPALRDLTYCELLAVSRARPELVEAFARAVGARKWYRGWRELLLDNEIDAVYIATPVHLHAAQTVAAAEAGKHVLCEKPMAMSVGECDQMIAACRANKVKLGIAYYRRFYPALGRIKEVLATGELGVQEPERADDALDGAADGTGLQPDPFADAERPRAQQHHSGEQVAERLLRGKTEDHGGERAGGDERGRAHAGDVQRHEDRDPDRHESDEETNRPGGARVHPAEERGAEQAADVAGDGPTQREQRQHRRGRDRVDPTAVFADAEPGLVVVVDDYYRDEQRPQKRDATSSAGSSPSAPAKMSAAGW